jgi:hypothetical protein
VQFGQARRYVRRVERIGECADEQSLVERQVLQFAFEQEIELVPQFERSLPEIGQRSEFNRRADRVTLGEDR